MFGLKIVEQGNIMAKKNINFYDWFLIPYFMLNGFAVGNTMNATNDIFDKGYDRDKLMVLGMWLLLTVYSAHRIYKIYKDKKNFDNDDNQKQR